MRASLRKVLYILSKGPAPLSDVLLPKEASPGKDISFLLIQDAVSLTQVPGAQTYALVDDVRARNVRTRFPTVSYRGMLRMIFDADAVIALSAECRRLIRMKSRL